MDLSLAHPRGDTSAESIPDAWQLKKAAKRALTPDTN